MTTAPYETINHHGFTIEVHQDPESREIADELDDGTGVTLFTWHRRYNFGAKPPAWATEAKDEGTLNEAIAERFSDVLVMPVFMYEHGGIRLSCSSFSCHFDSGQLGVIFAPLLTQRWDETTQAWVPTTNENERREATEAYLRAKVSHLDDLVSGNVWGYVIKTPEGNELEEGSCWGFVGDGWREDAGMIGEARACIDHEIEGRNAGERLVAESFAL